MSKEEGKGSDAHSSECGAASPPSTAAQKPSISLRMAALSCRPCAPQQNKGKHASAGPGRGNPAQPPALMHALPPRTSIGCHASMSGQPCGDGHHHSMHSAHRDERGRDAALAHRRADERPQRSAAMAVLAAHVGVGQHRALKAVCAPGAPAQHDTSGNAHALNVTTPPSPAMPARGVMHSVPKSEPRWRVRDGGAGRSASGAHAPEYL